jgi:dTDP-4-amino-4,6-dideoxy-D-glucose acyltransferase
MNFKKIGKNVKISPKASIYGAENIEIGDNVRIDDFCILSAGKQIKIGSHIHIACYSCLIGKESIILGDFVTISMRSIILSSSDDYSGNHLIGPIIDEQFLQVTHAPVIMNDLVAIGAAVVVLPGVTLGEGSGVATQSLVKKDVPEFHMVGGIPAKFLFERSKVILNVKDRYLTHYYGDP